MKGQIKLQSRHKVQSLFDASRWYFTSILSFGKTINTLLHIVIRKQLQNHQMLLSLPWCHNIFTYVWITGHNSAQSCLCGPQSGFWIHNMPIIFGVACPLLLAVISWDNVFCQSLLNTFYDKVDQGTAYWLIRLSVNLTYYCVWIDLRIRLSAENTKVP